jgi:methyltransferase (TIGR00027 family)
MVLDYKAKVLRDTSAQPNCEWIVVVADLTQPWIETLERAGYQREQPSGWLLEGFLFYLEPHMVTSLLTQASGLCAPGSWLGFDIINNAMLTSPLTHSWIEMQKDAGAPWIGTLDDPLGFLTQLGWTAQLSQAGQPDAHHGRWKLPVLPTNMPNVPHNWYVVAHKEV